MMYPKARKINANKLKKPQSFLQEQNLKNRIHVTPNCIKNLPWLINLKAKEKSRLKSRMLSEFLSFLFWLNKQVPNTLNVNER